MVTHSSVLAWRILWTEEPGGLQSTGSQRVGHDWVTDTRAVTEGQCSEGRVRASWGLTGLWGICLKICHPWSQLMVFFCYEEIGQQMFCQRIRWEWQEPSRYPAVFLTQLQRVIWGTVCLNPSKRIPSVVPYAWEWSSFTSHMGCIAAVGIAISWLWKSVPEGSQIGVVLRTVWGRLWS